MVDANGTEWVSPAGLPSELSGHCKGTVWWLHPPKTGTSFVVSANRCPWTKGRSRGLHDNIPANASDDFLRTVVGMFRDPEERLMSAYTWIGLEPRCCTWEWGWEAETFLAAKLLQLDSHDVPPHWGREVETFVPTRREVVAGEPPGKVLGRFRGCYTNMITGKRGCMAGQAPAQDEVEEALRRLSLFRFVGLTRQWRLSICLFNFLTEGRRFVTERQLYNNRPTHSQSGTAYDTSGMPDDPADGRIYEAVERRFWREVREHGIADQSCPME